MGAYSRTEKSVNGGYPVYTKEEPDAKTHYLYRSSGASRSGKWKIAESQSSMEDDTGAITSVCAASLPTEAGLVFRFYDGNQWVEHAVISMVRCMHRDPGTVSSTPYA